MGSKQRDPQRGDCRAALSVRVPKRKSPQIFGEDSRHNTDWGRKCTLALKQLPRAQLQHRVQFDFAALNCWAACNQLLPATDGTFTCRP